MTDPAAPKPAPKRRWALLALRVVGLALLVFVILQVDWKDSVVLADGTIVKGEIQGDVPRWDAPGAQVTLATDAGARTFVRGEIREEALGGDTAPNVNEGILRIVRRSDKTMLVIGFLLFGAITQIGVLRWWLLLRAQGIHVSFADAHRLTFVGFFFNNVVPGPTGGDVIKAVYVARRTDKRAQAVVTVLVDRVAGIIALALIAAVVLAIEWKEPQYRELRGFIGIFLGAVALCAMLFFSRRIRRFLRIEQWSARLPAGRAIRQVDEAVFLWRYHKKALFGALGLSFANQLSIQGMMILFATGLHITTSSGDPVPWTSYMVVLPVAFIVSAVPVLPGSWGIREGAFAIWFHFVGVERNPAVALSVLNGATMFVWSLVGGIYFLQTRTSLGAAAEGAEVAEPVATGSG